MYFRNFCVCVTNPQRLNYTQILVAYPLWTLDCLCSASSSTTQILPFRDLVHVILTLQQHLPFSLPLLVLYLALLILILCQLICTTPSAGPPSSSSLSPGTIWFYLSIVLALLPIANGRNWLGTSKFHGQGDFMDNASRLFSLHQAMHSCREDSYVFSFILFLFYIRFLPLVPRFWINILAEDSLYTSSMVLVVRLHPQFSSLAITSRFHRYLTARILNTTKGTSSFQIERLLICGDIAKNPGARFSKVPVTFRARNQIFKSKYKE